MSTIIRSPCGNPENRVVPLNLTTSIPESFENLAADRRGSDGIKQQFYRDAATRPVAESVGKPETDVALPVDVGFHRYGGARPMNSVEHRRVEFVSVVVQEKPIALQKGHARCRGNAVDEFR